MDAHSNVEQLSFSFDNQKNKIPTVFIYNELDHSDPYPPITPLSPPLGLIPPLPTSIGDLKPVDPTLSKRSIPQAIMIGLAKAAQWAEAVTGEGSLDVVRYGQLLKARQLVGVRGVGPAFDGLHYVTSVTHNIKRGEYKQSFKLSRNGLLSTVPRLTSWAMKQEIRCRGARTATTASIAAPYLTTSTRSSAGASGARARCAGHYAFELGTSLRRACGQAGRNIHGPATSGERD
jgi:hypothetical protein